VEPLTSNPSDTEEPSDAPGGSRDETTPSEPTGEGRGLGRVVFEWVGLVVLALVIALLIKTFLFQAFYIPSESMVPTLKVHDRVLVNKLSYKLHPVHRGDIVVFRSPPHADPGINDLVKRVIGLPGESVSGHDGHVYIDGKLLPESYLPAGMVTSDFGPIALGKDSYWVMGDNRINSKDSRSFGPITKSKIVGRVFLRIWPLNRLDVM
jgi:signal peptidase I